MGIHVPGARDPTGRVRFLMKGDWEKPTEHLVHTTFWKEMGTVMEVPAVTKNLFVDLAERVSLSLSVTNCYVCAGTKMGEQWPWEAREVDYVKISRSPNLTWTDHQHPTRWVLQNSIIGSRCFIRPAGQKYNISMGAPACEAGMVCNTTRKWMDFNHAGSKIPPNPYNQSTQKSLYNLWEDPCGTSSSWEAPDHQYWICGTAAYVSLPPTWAGSCVLGTIKPSFFLLPIRAGERLGVPVYESRGWTKQSLGSPLRIGNWKDNEWPPERIIQYYGPATWAQDGTYGYRTPIYMLNRIIRLQAVLEIFTNETSLALSLLAKTNTQLCTAVYQNRLALDYLLAMEGGVCGKFNLSNCCFQINDQGKAIEEITGRMCKLAHVPAQTWQGLDTPDWFGS
ncbi:endogenous retrovirus group 3 member 1 Env polyprotein-like [Hemicordylus capensis]|uniref:endogenous retrovirus group 3 member 1 Env polyprotein-like n=1 Tax=Hemicordylus capensis TaxID=884348 RepID=UPI0023023724|nr:endogenous retrovirus group 3 member 1 Env polyprotein-like [Hemicordylus capensis]